MRIRSSLRVLTLEASCASGEGHNQASWENAFERTDCIILEKLLGWGMAYSCVKIKGKPEEKKKGEQTNLEDERGKLHLCPLVVSNLRSDDDHTSLSPHPLSPSRPLALSPSPPHVAILPQASIGSCHTWLLAQQDFWGFSLLYRKTRSILSVTPNFHPRVVVPLDVVLSINVAEMEGASADTDRHDTIMTTKNGSHSGPSNKVMDSSLAP